ncbi:protein NRD1-like [Teratosphaeria destructans]|uniref:Protein NRD1-like n=1 Tax=Teratosphaeria destructans TaxID=418781 RepID=A0A9W7SW09_9PEZI|nr:protein NRD1-like [Teratosphaeria destructans]
MATNIITELDQQLASLNQLKPPGASKGKIATITQLCVSNIQAETNIVQSLYRALKKAPATHKLGALYVIDSVVRQWIEKSKQNGQDLNIEGRGEPGTYPAAVKRVTELMPALFDDIIKGLPEEQKPKLENMVGIWEKSSTFPAKLLIEFRQKLKCDVVRSNGTAPTTTAVAPTVQVGGKCQAPVPSRPCHTPIGYPPQHLYERGLIPNKPTPAQTAAAPALSQPAPPAPPAPPAQQPAPAQDVNSLLAQLANIMPASVPAAPQPVPQPAALPPPQSLPPQLPPNIAALFAQSGLPPPPFPPPPAQPQTPAFSAPPPMQIPGFPLPQGFPGYPPQPPPSIPQQYAVAPPPPQPQHPAPPADPLAPLRGILPHNILNDQAKLVMALNLLQDLQKQGLPMEQWGPVLQAFSDAQPSTEQSNGHDQYSRRRSRSPDRGGRRGGRASPVYGTYEEIAAKNASSDDRGNKNGRGRNYRQRSPITRNSPGTVAMNGMPMQPKYVALDTTLPPDHIKVLSRTLFVGGVNGSPAEIEALFERFGRVQTCIAQKEKRHAFVKMTTRQHAVNAKQGVDALQAANDREVMQIARQTKWGVGFGPRECCDYQRGESIIPIHKLTDADVKWLLTAEFGGTGGRPLEGGMVLEEPDIEIGAGVSSKAMSKRVIPQEGAAPETPMAPPPQQHQQEQHQPRAGRKRDRRNDDHEDHSSGAKHEGGGGKSRHNRKHKKHQHDYDRDATQQYGSATGAAAGQPGLPYGGFESYQLPARQPEPVAVATPPAVPTFGFSLPGVGGAPAYR